MNTKLANLSKLNFVRFLSNSPLYSLRSNVKQIQSSPTLLINELITKRLANKQTVYHFGFGQSPFPVPSPLVSSLQKNAHRNEYMPVKGYQPLREAIAATIPDRSADDILIGPGSKELLYLTQLAYECDLILPTPTWVSYVPQSIMFYKIKTKAENRYNLSAEDLERFILGTGVEKPRMILLTHPNNPTSISYSLNEMNDIVAIARKYNCVILSDEIYLKMSFGNTKSFAEIYPEGAIVSSGLSKWAGAGGWRIGYTSYPPNMRWLLDAVSNLASNSFTTASAPIQAASVSAFVGFEDEISLYCNQTVRLLEWLNEYCYNYFKKNSNCSVHMGDGAFYLFPDFSKCEIANYWERKGMKGNMITEDLLRNCGVAALSASDFLSSSDHYAIRVALTQFDGKRMLDNFPRRELSESEKEAFFKEFAPLVTNGIKTLCHYVSSNGPK